MTPMAKGTVAVTIGVGIFLLFILQSERTKRSLGLGEDTQAEPEVEGGDQRVVSKTGAYQNTKFMHLVDYKFGASLVNILMQNNIASITDMGCGTGAYVKMFSDFNIQTQGFDGNPDTKKWDVSGGLCEGPVDITEPKFWDETDAAMSIEVAEHIPAEYEQKFLDNLVSSARHLIFLSWGVPGQGGDFHVNGQWGADVVKKMNNSGWERHEALTQTLQNEAEFDYLKRNVQVFSKVKGE